MIGEVLGTVVEVIVENSEVVLSYGLLCAACLVISRVLIPALRGNATFIEQEQILDAQSYSNEALEEAITEVETGVRAGVELNPGQV